MMIMNISGIIQRQRQVAYPSLGLRRIFSSDNFATNTKKLVRWVSTRDNMVESRRTTTTADDDETTSAVIRLLHHQQQHQHYRQCKCQLQQSQRRLQIQQQRRRRPPLLYNNNLWLSSYHYLSIITNGHNQHQQQQQLHQQESKMSYSTNTTTTFESLVRGGTAELLVSYKSIVDYYNYNYESSSKNSNSLESKQLVLLNPKKLANDCRDSFHTRGYAHDTQRHNKSIFLT